MLKQRPNLWRWFRKTRFPVHRHPLPTIVTTTGAANSFLPWKTAFRRGYQDRTRFLRWQAFCPTPRLSNCAAKVRPRRLLRGGFRPSESFSVAGLTLFSYGRGQNGRTIGTRRTPIRTSWRRRRYMKVFARRGLRCRRRTCIRCLGTGSFRPIRENWEEYRLRSRPHVRHLRRASIRRCTAPRLHSSRLAETSTARTIWRRCERCGTVTWKLAESGRPLSRCRNRATPTKWWRVSCHVGSFRWARARMTCRVACCCSRMWLTQVYWCFYLYGSSAHLVKISFQ